MKLILSLLAVATLVSCKPHDYTKDRGFLRTEDRRYQLLDYNPPKHFYVDLKDMETGQVLKDVRVSKHCNNHRRNIKGSYYVIPVRVYKDERGGERREFVNLYDVFCR